MIKNYFKIAWRNLFRNKGFSLTNLLGLTIGITCAILILLWVKDEVNYDKSQKNYSEVYKVMGHRNFNNTIFTDEAMVLPLAASLEQQIPQVKHAVVTTFRQPYILTNGEAKLKKDGYTVSEHFFDVFSYKFIRGNAINAIREPASIVLTESAAKALFGDADPINKTVKVDNERDAKVTAVVADVPGNSSIQFDCIMPFNYSDESLKRSMANWQNSSWQVYLQTLPGAGIAAIEKKINEIKVLHDPGDKKITSYFAFPMSKWRLYSDFKDGKNVGGMIEYVRLFTIIAIIILLIACINFMNLSTARSEKRAKEVGIRKTLGSEKKQLVIQFFFESIILALISFVFSILAVYLLLPAFNTLVEKQLFLDFTQPQFWLAAFAIIVFTGVVAGSYPAIYLSSFSPIKVLKGTFNPGKNAVLPRHFLIVGQFVISILLISATIIVYQQINLVKNRATGYNPNNLISIPGSPETQKNYTVIKNELLQTGLISSVTRTMSPITEIYWKSPAPDWTGKPANLNLIFTGLTTDNDFTKTMGIKVLQGKDFSGAPVDSSSVLLNAAAVQAMNIKDPVGMQIRNGNKEFTVIGVVDNIVMESPFTPVDPMMAFYNPDNSNWISMRLNKDVQPQQALTAIETVFKKYNPAVPFEYRFVDKEFQRKFLTEDLISKLANIFALLAIFICCIGLAGLASFTIIKRLREIGVRKVLGATIQQLLLLISKEFLKLVAIAFIIAVPLTWWFMHNWLLKYDYRVNISIWVFVIVGILMLLLTMAVVGLNTISAAMRNPVKSLKAD
ncbi:ABC transporter permease [Ferruginibacter paludis]|uniref:ABC transporter permease n=1 Tax=Ferruginibacter paludis TaxID=1310417 RepID=UPI0025B5CEFD|nr:ABC transporter permease [Ferruginibacter paludis]MDN3655935.1 ABC transporter permease [Ferruginibacter paludis]